MTQLNSSINNYSSSNSFFFWNRAKLKASNCFRCEVMDLLKGHIAVIPKSQSRFGHLQFLIAFISWAGVISSLSEFYSKDKVNFKCNVSKDSSLVNQLCYNIYAEQYNSPLPQFTFALINGCALVGIWIVFALYLGPQLLFYKRQAEVARAANGPHQLRMHARQAHEDKCIGSFCSYLLQIFIRVTFLVTMVALLLSYQTFEFHQSFNCQLTRKEDNINASSKCSDAYFAEKYHINITMLALDLILILLAVVEAIVLLRNFKVIWQRRPARDSENVHLLEIDEFTRQRNFYGFPIPSDAEFIPYLFRENLQEEINETVLKAGQISDDFKETIIEMTNDLFIALPLPLPFEAFNTDELYTTVVLRSEKVNIRENASTNTEQLTLGEIFIEKAGNSLKEAKRILIYGCAGVGKSMLCQKLIRDWATGEPFSRRFKFVFLLKFQELNYMTVNISLSRLLNCSPFSPIDDDTCRCIARLMPSSILIIFYGIEQFHSLSCCARDLLNYDDDNEAEMPVSAWYAKLVCGKVLKGCTVVTTARENAVNRFPRRFKFDKIIKLCGFTIERAKSFIGKLLESEPEARDLVCEFISNNCGMESLVCLPENCIIICCSFLYKVRQANADIKLSRSLTLTEIYDCLLHLFTTLHNPRCVETISELEGLSPAVLEKLFALAYRGIESDKSLFSRRDLEEFSLPEKGIEPLIESGLLQCLPLTQTGPACFETQYCFASILMQEFLAAKHLATKLFSSQQEFISVMKAVEMSTKWDMAIQFVAGLIKGDEVKMSHFIRGLQSTRTHFEVRSEGEQLLLAARCCFEHNNDSITSTELAANIQGHIDLNGCSASASDNRVIFYLLSRCGKGAISTLRMSNNIVGSKECEQLASLMASGHGPTEELDFSNNSIGDDGVGPLCEGLRNKHCSLQHLILSGNGISRRGIEWLLDALKESPCQLRILDLAYNNFDHANALQLSELLVDESLPLKNLSLAGCRIDDSVVGCLINPLTDSRCHIQVLDISDNNAVTEYGIALLAGALKEEECYVQSLKLSGNRLTNESVEVLSQSLASRLCKIQSLDLASTGITDIGTRHIARALRSRYCSLKCLDLSANSFGNSGCSCIATAAASSSSTLQVLMMNQNGISDHGALCFVNCFKRPKLSKLSSLFLNDNRISEQCKSELLCCFLDLAFYWKQPCGKLYV